MSAGVAAAKSGFIPALSRSCDAPSGDEPGRLRYTERESPRRKGSPHGNQRANSPPSADAEVELVRSKTWLSFVLIGLIAASACAKTAPKPAVVALTLKVVAANGSVTVGQLRDRMGDSYSTYPANAPRTKLSAFTPNVEAIANYRPDLVVVSDDTNHIVSQLEKLSIPVLVEPAAVDLAGAYSQIEQLATVTGHSADGQRVVTGVKNQIQAILGSMPQPTRKLTSIPSSIRPITRPRRTRSSGRSTRCSGSRTSPTRRGARVTIHSCRLSTSSRATRT